MSEFDQFWTAYPRKTAKATARVAFLKALRKTTLPVMLTALAWQIQSRQWREGYVPHPATWLNQERWLDEPFFPKMVVAQSPESLRQIEAIKQQQAYWSMTPEQRAEAKRRLA